MCISLLQIVLYVRCCSEQTWRLAFKDVLCSWFSVIEQKSLELLIRAISTDKVHITTE